MVVPFFSFFSSNLPKNLQAASVRLDYMRVVMNLFISLSSFVFLISTTGSGYSNSPVIQSQLEAIHMKWSSIQDVTSDTHYKFEGCLDVLKQFKERGYYMSFGGRLNVLSVCNESVNLGDTLAVLDFCNSLTLFQNISQLINSIPQIETFMSNLTSVYFIDSLGKYKISFNLLHENVTAGRSTKSAGDRMSPSCLADPRLSQSYITTATTSPKLLVIVNLINGYNPQATSIIQGIIERVISYRNDYIAYLSRERSEQYNISNHIELVERATAVNVAAILDAANKTITGNNTEVGNDWVNLATFLSLLTEDLSTGVEPCNRILVVLVEGDISNDVADILQQAISTNMQLQIFIYSLTPGSAQNNSRSKPNINRLVFEGRTSFEEVTVDNDTVASLQSVQDALSFKAGRSTLRVSLNPGPDSSRACVGLYHRELVPILPGNLKTLAGVVCLEINFTEEIASAMENDSVNCTDTVTGLHCQTLLLDALKLRRSIGQTLLTLNSSCQYSVCSQVMSPIENFTRPILDYLHSVLVLSTSIVRRYEFVTNGCPRDGILFHSSCSRTGWTEPQHEEMQSACPRIPFTFHISSVFVANKSLGEGVDKIQTLQGFRESLCASAYLEDDWRMLTSLIPQISFQYFDHHYEYIRSYPGYQATNRSCVSRSYQDMVPPTHGTNQVFISELTGEAKTRYCQPVNHTNDIPELIGLICINIPISLITTPLLEEPEPSSSTPTIPYSSTSQWVEEEITPTTTLPVLQDVEYYSNGYSLDSSEFEMEESTEEFVSYTSFLRSMSSVESLISHTSLIANDPSPTPLVPSSSEAGEFVSDVKDYLQYASSTMKYAYLNLMELDGNESCPYGNQLSDSCESSCIMGGSGEDLCVNVFGECRGSSDVNQIYVNGQWNKTLSLYNYSLRDVHQCNQGFFRRLCMTQSLFEEDKDEQRPRLLQMMPTSVYYVDSLTGFVSSLPSSDCSAHGNETNCEGRSFDARDSTLYSTLLWGDEDVYIVVNVQSESNLNAMKGATLEFVNLIPHRILRKLFFQSTCATGNFRNYVLNQTFVSGVQFDKVIQKALMKILESFRNASILLLTDSCMSEEDSQQFTTLSIRDVFVYTIGDTCANPIQARKIACSYQGEWHRLNFTSYNEGCGNDQNGVLEAVMSFFRFRSTLFAQRDDQVVWREMGMESDLYQNGNGTLSACIPVLSNMTCLNGCTSHVNLLGLTCMEFDRSRIQSLDGSQQVIQKVINQSELLLNYQILSHEEREILRINKCSMDPRITTPTGSSPPPLTNRIKTSSVHPSSTQRPRRSGRLRGGYVAAIILGAVAMISGSVCVGYWTFTTWTEYHKNRRHSYRSKESEDDPFSTNYKKLHENMAKEDD